MKIKLKNPALKDELKEKETKIKVRLPISISRPKAPAPAPSAPNIKIKLGPKSKPQTKTSHVPRIRVKPTRIPGDGYDSEDSEIEDDPLVEEAIIIRMLPDAELDYVRHCVESGDMSGISIRWKDRRRCWIYVNNTTYVGKLMRLPNIIEANKSVDKKNIFKTVDITEILVVLKRVQSEDEINDISPSEEEYHSGLTAPLKNITKSQYRRKLTKDRIEAIEARVDELLRMDEEAMQTSYELVDPETIGHVEESILPTSDSSRVLPSRVIDEEETALEVIQASKEKEEQSLAQETRADEEDEEIADGIDDLELELEQALEGGDLEGLDDEEEDEEEDEDDDDDSDNENGMHRKVEVDEDEQHNALLRDEISELEITIKNNQSRLDKTSNALLRNRIISSITKLEQELENKKRQLKIGEDKTTSKKQQEDGDESRSNSARNTSTMGQDMDDDDDEDDDGNMDDEDDDGQPEPEGESDVEGDVAMLQEEGENIDLDDADLEDLFG